RRQRGRSVNRDRATAETVLAVLAVGAAAVGIWPLVVAVSAPLPVTGLVAHVSGMLAGYGVLVLLVLVSRWPVLERGLGADVLARAHAVLGRTVLTLVLVHAVTAVMVWAQLTGQSVGSAFLEALGWQGMVAATVGAVLLCAAAGISIRAARRKVSHETWHRVHLLTYLAVALSFVHQLAGPDLAGRPLLQVLWSLLYTGAFGLVLTYRVLAPLRSASRHRLRVVAVVPEAPGVVSVIVEGRLVHELAAQSGQFFRWRFLTPGLWLTAHPFSLSAPPVGNRMRLTVKALGDGSGRVQQVPVGTRVIAEGPYGALTASRRTRRDVLLVAGGVGITPMRALFETLPLTAGQDLVLLYRADHRDQIVFRAELDALAAERHARVVYLLGDNPDLLSAPSLDRLVPGLAERDVYLCGPPGMTAALRSSLAHAGVPDRHVHEERFAL
ncbi:MAG: ferredoxin reductase family protein, partial [Actinobacteria bacterium]|nr:ferredoxin reductase family protein [Actinomycetota bacterium]